MLSTSVSAKRVSMGWKSSVYGDSKIRLGSRRHGFANAAETSGVTVQECHLGTQDQQVKTFERGRVRRLLCLQAP